ncbi:MAG: DUF805 domain-containing protein [Bacteroidota bacterium]
MKYITTKHNGISIIQSYKNTLTKRYATFSGRANRDEYCAFLLVYYILSLFVNIFLSVPFKWVAEHQEAILSHDIAAVAQVPMRIVLGILCIALLTLLHLISQIGLLVRRVHDLNVSGWWLILPFLLLASPLLINILLAVLGLLPGTPAPNQYGHPPAKKDSITLTNYLLVSFLVSGFLVV